MSVIGGPIDGPHAYRPDACLPGATRMNNAVTPAGLIAAANEAGVELVVQPVVLAGGSGRRLWPLSREHWPRQLIDLHGGARHGARHARRRCIPAFGKRVDQHCAWREAPARESGQDTDRGYRGAVGLLSRQRRQRAPGRSVRPSNQQEVARRRATSSILRISSAPRSACAAIRSRAAAGAPRDRTPRAWSCGRCRHGSRGRA